MASVFIDEYHVYYSIVSGKVKEFEEFIDGEYVPVTDDYDKKLAEVVSRIKKSESFKEAGYPAFVKKIEQQNKEVKAKS